MSNFENMMPFIFQLYLRVCENQIFHILEVSGLQSTETTQKKDIQSDIQTMKAKILK